MIWAPIAKFALEGAIHAHRELGLEKDGEWANLATAYLRVRSKSMEGVSWQDRPSAEKVDEKSELQVVISGLRGMQEEHTGKFC